MVADLPRIVYMEPTKMTDDSRPGSMTFGELVMSWVGYWIFIIVALLILAGVALLPLLERRRGLAYEFSLLQYENFVLTGRVGDMANRIEALGEDPQYAERIAMQELNLRRPGVETLRVSPVPAESNGENVRPVPGPGYAETWYLRPFLIGRNRPYLLAMSGGLLLGALLVSAGRRRYRYCQVEKKG